MYNRQAAEKLQENGDVQTQDQPVSVSSSNKANVMSTLTITTAINSTITVSVESQHSKKVTYSQSGMELSVHKSNTLPSMTAVTTVSQTRCSAGSRITHPPLKPSSELCSQGKPGAEKVKASQQQVSSFSSCTTDASPQISTKMAKSKRGQKIGQPREMANLAPRKAAQKDAVQSVATSSCRSSLPAAGMASRCAHSVDSHASNAKSWVETSSKVVTRLPNGLVAAAGKAYPMVDRLSQTDTALLHGHSTKPTLQLPNDLRVHADRSPAKTSCLSSNSQCASKLGTDITNKTSRKTDEEIGNVEALKSSETRGQSSSLGLLVNGDTDETSTGAATKGKKTRRKGRGKAALTSVG